MPQNADHVRYVFVALIEAKHCSSLCLQSEGDKYWVAKHGMKIQQSNSPERWTCSLHVRAPHFASKVSYSAGAATDDCASTNLHCKGAGVQNQEKSLCGFEPNDMAVAPLPLKGRVFKIQKKSRTIFDQINAITH